MPVYVYRNLRTGETFEVAQRISEPALTEHPASGDPVKRLVQPVGIAFKGSGFYVNDSRKGSGSQSSKAKSDGETKAESTSDAKSDSKSDSKSETKSESKSDAKAESKTDSKSDGRTTSSSSKQGDGKSGG
ncbi:MAG: FmdB family zinc ribbon protein [Trueperaceae bacterium]